MINLSHMDEMDALKSPENLVQIKKFQQWADTLDEVDNSASLTDFIEEMHWGFNEEQDEFRSIPDNADLISQYLLVYDGNDLYDLVNFWYTFQRDIYVDHITVFCSKLRDKMQKFLIEIFSIGIDPYFTNI